MYILIGFINDVVRGIKKVAAKSEEPKTIIKETTVTSSNNIEPLLERAFMFLEDKNWQSANEYFEKVLDQDPKNAQAYLGKLLAELRCDKKEHLKDCHEPFYIIKIITKRHCVLQMKVLKTS